MRHIHLSLRLTALGIILGVVGFMALSPVRNASAVFVGNPAVLCLDIYLDNAPITTQGNPPGAEDTRSVIIMNRFDPRADGKWNVSPVSYIGANLGTTPPTDANEDCEANDDVANTLNVPQNGAVTWSRPAAIATLTGNELVWTICAEEDILGNPYQVLTTWTMTLTGASFSAATNYYGKQVAYIDTSTCTTTPDTTTYPLAVTGRYRPPNVGAPTAPDADDWDADGRTDYDELTTAVLGRGDPLRPESLVTSVGGVAELPDEQQALPLDAKNDSGTNMALIAGGVAAAITLVMVSAGSTALYVRRRTDK